MSRSNLTDAVAAFDRCSVDELRQLNAMITVRLGEPIPSKTRGGPGKQVGGGIRGKTSKGKAHKTARNPKVKGNPQRKSQYATHPVYKTYRDAQKALEREVKESKTLFKDITGPTRDAYVKALSAWLQTKSGFRSSKKEDESPDSESEEASEDGRGGGRSDALVTTGQTETQNGSPEASPKPKRRRLRSSVEVHVSKYGTPPDSWSPENGEEWMSLNRQVRKDVRRASLVSLKKSRDQMDQEG
jgi:hypothetical protein